jgi:hypothetical protein
MMTFWRCQRLIDYKLQYSLPPFPLPASCAKRVRDDAERVMMLLETKGAFLASSIWNYCSSCFGNSRITFQAQKEQLALDAAKAVAPLENRTDRQQKILATAQRALVKNHDCSALLTDEDWVNIIS